MDWGRSLAGSIDAERDLLALARPHDPADKRRVLAELEAGLFGRAVQRKRLGRYALGEPIGAGASGVVYEAHDPELGRAVAIKLIERPRRRADAGRATRRLLDEAQALARLSHPNVVEVLDAGSYDGGVYIVMHLMTGDDLRGWQRGASRRPSEVVDLFVGAGRGLAAAHRVGIVHRDFKPDNVLLDAQGRARVADFGLVYDLSGTLGSDRPSPSEGESDPDRTRVVGTPGYMAPEQHLGAACDARTDQYAFCVALFEALEGQRPFGADSMEALYAEKIRGDVPRMRRGAPPHVVRALRRGLSPTPRDRYPDMDALLQALTRRRRGRAWAFGAFGVAAGVLLLLDALPVQRCDEAARRVESVWSDAERSAVEAALTDSKHRWAWPLVHRSLDGYAQTWISAHDRVCLARPGTPPKQFDLQMACLTRSLDALAVVVSALATGHAPQPALAATGLPSVQHCAGPDLEHAQIPADPALAERVEQLRRELARTKTLVRVGAVDDTAALEAQAERLGFDPVLAEVVLLSATVADKRGDYEESRAQMERAYWLAQSSGHDATAAEAATDLVFSLANNAQRVNAALQWAKTARAALERLGPAPRIEGELETAVSAAYRAKGDDAEAQAHLERALEIYADNFPPTHPQLAAAAHNLGKLATARGDNERGLELVTQAHAALERTFGGDHPEVARALDSMGNALDRLGRHEEAAARYSEALAQRERTLGKDHPSTAETLNNLAILRQNQRRFDEADQLFTRCARVLAGALGSDHPTLGVILSNHASVMLALGRIDESIQTFQRAVDVLERAHGLDAPILANPLTGLGEAQLEAAQPRAAARVLERALTLRHTATVLERAQTQFVLAIALGELGETPRRAEELARAAKEGYAVAGQDELVRKVDAWLLR